MPNVRTVVRTVAPALAAAALCLLPAFHAFADEAPALTDANFMQLDEMLPSLRGRPNEEFRVQGLKAYQQGHYDDAIHRFELASEYADKYSQHYLSLIHLARRGHAGGSRAGLHLERPGGRARQPAPAGDPREDVGAVERAGTGARARCRCLVLRALRRRRRQAARRSRDPPLRTQHDRQSRRLPQPAGRHRRRTGERRLLREVGSDAAAYAVSVAGSPDELYGKEGGLKRLDTYWQEQDRLLDGTVEVGELETVRRNDRRRPDGDR